MNVLTWSFMGLNSPNKQWLLKHCILNSKVDIILLQEMKLSSEEMGKFRRSLGWREIMDSSKEGASRCLAIIWDTGNITISS